MKFSSITCLGLLGATASSVLYGVDAARGSSAAEPDFLQTLQRNQVRRLMKEDDKGEVQTDAAGNLVDGTAPLLEDQCYICTKAIGNVPKVNERPTEIRAMYIAGTGVISRYQDGEKATCRNQTFPDSGLVEIKEYGWSQNLTNGTIFTFFNPTGEMDANTIFTFSNGVECGIHTSCSQPLVAGDQLGPILLLEANNCTFSFCGDGTKDEDEECDEGDAMPTATCRNCTIPICGDGV